jgi:hypothetical protein
MWIDYGMIKIIIPKIKSGDGEEAYVDNLLAYARGSWEHVYYSTKCCGNKQGNGKMRLIKVSKE